MTASISNFPGQCWPVLKCPGSKYPLSSKASDSTPPGWWLCSFTPHLSKVWGWWQLRPAKYSFSTAGWASPNSARLQRLFNFIFQNEEALSLAFILESKGPLVPLPLWQNHQGIFTRQGWKEQERWDAREHPSPLRAVREPWQPERKKNKSFPRLNWFVGLPYQLQKVIKTCIDGKIEDG